MPPKLRSKNGRHVVIRRWPPCERALSFGMRNCARFPLSLLPLWITQGSQVETGEGVFARMGAAVAWLSKQYVRRPVERGTAASPGQRLFEFEALRASDQADGQENAWLNHNPAPLSST